MLSRRVACAANSVRPAVAASNPRIGRAIDRIPRPPRPQQGRRGGVARGVIDISRPDYGKIRLALHDARLIIPAASADRSARSARDLRDAGLQVSDEQQVGAGIGHDRATLDYTRWLPEPVRSLRTSSAADSAERTCGWRAAEIGCTGMRFVANARALPVR